jgi:hypothetical protein
MKGGTATSLAVLPWRKNPAVHTGWGPEPTWAVWRGLVVSCSFVLDLVLSFLPSIPPFFPQRSFLQLYSCEDSKKTRDQPSTDQISPRAVERGENFILLQTCTRVRSQITSYGFVVDNVMVGFLRVLSH